MLKRNYYKNSVKKNYWSAVQYRASPMVEGCQAGGPGHLLQYMREYNAETHTGQEKVQLYCEDDLLLLSSYYLPMLPCTSLWFVYLCVLYSVYCLHEVFKNLDSGVVYLSARSSVSHSSMICLLVYTVCTVLLCTCLPGPLSPTPLSFVYWCVQCVLYCCVPVC